MTAKSTGKPKTKPAPKTSQSKKKPAQAAAPAGNRRAEAALRRKQEFARTLLDNVADGVVACNAEGILVLFNRVAREWHGVDALALPPEEWGAHYDLYGPDGITPLPTEAIPLFRAFRGETVREADMSIVAKGQPPRRILAAGGPFLDARHRPLGAVVVMRDITERKRAEEDLKASNEELQSLTEELLNSNEELAASREDLRAAARYSRTLIEASLDPLVTISVAGTITDVNAATEQITGLSRDRLIGSDFADYFTEPDLARAGYREVLAQGRVIDYPLALRHVSGAIADVLYNATVYRDERGNVQGVFAAARDVTERQRVEAALRESEERYRALIEKSSEAHLTIDENARYVDCNQAALDMLRIATREQLFGLSPVDLSPERQPDGSLSSEKARAIIELAFAEGSNRFEWVHRKADGEALPVEVVTTVIPHHGKNLLHSVWRDITERKRAEEALRRSEARYRRITEGLTDYLYTVRVADGRAVETTQGPACAIVTGYSAEDYAADPNLWIQMVVPEDRARVREHVRLTLAGEDAPAIEHRIVRKDGVVRWVSDTAILLKDASGRLLSYDGVISDITERRRAEEAHGALRDQLHQAQKAESLGRMAGAIAHHYNNLLGVVLLNLEMALTALPADARARKYLADATKASQRAAEISHQMLAYLGQDRGRREPVDLGDACREALPLLRSSLPVSARLHTAFPAGETVVRADATQLKRVLTYLAANAGEALGDGEGDITVSIDVLPAADVQASRFHPADWTPKAGTYACLSVADTGGGMTPETLDKVFDPFYSTKFTGRGLGLPVVGGIVMAHEGACAVESEFGRGTTFRVYLPVVAGQPPQSRQAVPVESETGRDQGLVLVVEDEPMLRDLTRTVLRDIGYQVVEAADGTAAVAVFREHQDQILCVLCDLTMPGMDGWATLEALRRLRPDVPAILTSGYDEAQVMAGDHAERPQAFLHKPYLSAELKAALAAALKGR